MEPLIKSSKLGRYICREEQLALLNSNAIYLSCESSNSRSSFCACSRSFAICIVKDCLCCLSKCDIRRIRSFLCFSLCLLAPIANHSPRRVYLCASHTTSGEHTIAAFLLKKSVIESLKVTTSSWPVNKNAAIRHWGLPRPFKDILKEKEMGEWSEKAPIPMSA